MKKDPYEENIQKKCSVCEHELLVDQYGNGTCKNCSWHNQIFDRANQDSVVYPNLVPLNKARRFYKEGKPFEVSLDDFLGGLYFYTEMEFVYNEKKYGVMLVTNNNVETIEFFECNAEMFQVFKTKEEFLEKANIEGKLLKDIWNLVKDPYWLS